MSKKSQPQSMQLFGFYNKQGRNHNVYQHTAPYYVDGKNIVTMDGDNIRELTKKEKKDNAHQVDVEVYGTFEDTIIVTGENFANSLDKLHILHSIREWNTYGNFYWKLASEAEYEHTHALWGREAAAWLEYHLAHAREYDKEAIREALSLMYIYGATSAEDWALSGAAAAVAGLEDRIKFNKLVSVQEEGDDYPDWDVTPFVSVEEYDAEVANYILVHKLSLPISDDNTN
jgi:hypothetical protein